MFKCIMVLYWSFILDVDFRIEFAYAIELDLKINFLRMTLEIKSKFHDF